MNEMEQIKELVGAEMRRNQQKWRTKYPGEDWDISIYAAWRAATEDAANWRRVATVLTFVCAGLCVMLIWFP